MRSTARPEFFSARWAGPNKDFNAAMAQIERLLQERGAKAPAQRQAHFVSALCVAWPDHHLEEVEARVDGTLVWPPRGAPASATIRRSCRTAMSGPSAR